MNQFAKPGLAEEKLPPVGSTDNGKVLGVSEGAWAKISAPSGLPEVGADDKDKYLHTNAFTGKPEWASGGSGGGVLVVTATLTADGTGTCDKTMGEIWTAAQTMPVILVENLAPVGIIGITQATIKYTNEPSYILRGVNTNYRATSLDDYPSVDSGDEPGGT